MDGLKSKTEKAQSTVGPLWVPLFYLFLDHGLMAAESILPDFLVAGTNIKWPVSGIKMYESIKVLLVFPCFANIFLQVRYGKMFLKVEACFSHPEVLKIQQLVAPVQPTIQ